MQSSSAFSLVLVAALSAGGSSPSAPGTNTMPTAGRGYAYEVTPVRAHAVRPGYPEILRIELNWRHFSSHDQIEMQVVTSDNVVRVTNQEMGYGGSLRERSPGHFRGQGRVPGIPFFLRKMRIELRYTATTANGKTASASAPVTF
jgi:hypothetical protein